MKPDKEVGFIPTEDHYFLGRLGLEKELQNRSFIETTSKEGGFMHHLLASLKSLKTKGESSTVSRRGRVEFSPTGFAEMAFVDRKGLDREHYSFRYLRREFLGEVRCLVFDVEPRPHAGNGRFRGRIWVEDQDYNIVRFNGTYVASGWHVPSSWHYLHFDSWRTNMIAGQWLPTYIYSEESELPRGVLKESVIKAQTRLWSYNVWNGKGAGNADEDAYTQVLVDPSDQVKDQSDSGEGLSPVAARRAWENMAETNVLDRLGRAGLLAPLGEVDKVLETVVNNLLATNNLQVNPEIHCRVLLTSPFESFTVGQTIIVSRGLLDVLPDEASLAAVLAHELAHISLGHTLDTKFAFADRTFFEDPSAFARLQMGRTAEEEMQADKMSLEILQKSPYANKLPGVGLFLRQLEDRRAVLRNLVHARIGNPTMLADKQLRLSSVLANAPELQKNKLDQIAAMPLGSRIKVNPWSNQVQLSKSRPIALFSAREKMPFEVTPVYPFLTRFGTVRSVSSAVPQVNSEPRPEMPAAVESPTSGAK